jgi:Zn-dependent protease with chaperone function
MVAMLVCMLALLITVLFSGEARVLLRAGDYWTPVLLVAFFLIGSLIMRRVMVERAVYRPAIILNGRKTRVALALAHKRVQEYVRQRAAELGLDAELETYYVPGSWRSVDAYVFGSGLHQTVVVTGGLQALFIRRGPGELERFRFVIDHELGHIAGQDTSILYLARAALVTAPLFIPVKLWLMWILGPGRVLRAYTDVLPGSLDASYLFSPTVPFFNEASETFVISFFSAFGLIAAFLLWSLYVGMVRRREFVADRYAVAHSRDEREAREAMRGLLFAGKALAHAPAHAFLGRVRWHPDPVDRVAQVSGEAVSAIPERLGIAVVILTLIGLRLLLGVTTDPREQTWDVLTLIPVSGVFALLVGVVVDSFLEDSRAQGKLSVQAAGLWQLVLWTTTASAAIAWAFQFAGQPKDGGFSRSNLAGFEHLIAVEQLERVLLFFSLPVTLLIFGVVFIVLGRAWSLSLGWGPERFVRTTVGSGLAVLLLWGTSAIFAAPLRAYRAEKYMAYWKERVAVVQDGKWNQVSFLDSITKYTGSHGSDGPAGLAGATGGTGPEGGKGDKPGAGSLAAEGQKPGEGDLENFGVSQSPETSDSFRSYQALLPWELRIARERLRHEFSPPLAFVTLWEGPLRASML